MDPATQKIFIETLKILIKTFYIIIIKVKIYLNYKIKNISINQNFLYY